MTERTVVAADNGMIYCNDGSVWIQATAPNGSLFWREMRPVPGTQRAAETSTRTVRAAS